MENARMQVQLERPVDGDTVRVRIGDKSESLRIQALDTEESKAGGDKPVTPWGKNASEHAATLFTAAKVITLDFDEPQDAEVQLDLSRFRDNFGRLLALVFVDGEDFHQHMIEEGYSPYFRTYHRRYLAAEQLSQSRRAGVWDQVAVNGSEQRNYAALGAWWSLRAELIDDYRRARASGATSLNPRVDFAAMNLAERNQSATVFTEFSEYRRLGSRKAGGRYRLGGAAVFDVYSRHRSAQGASPSFACKRWLKRSSAGMTCSRSSILRSRLRWQSCACWRTGRGNPWARCRRPADRGARRGRLRLLALRLVLPQTPSRARPRAAKAWSRRPTAP